MITINPQPAPSKVTNDAGKIWVTEKSNKKMGITNVPIVNNLPFEYVCPIEAISSAPESAPIPRAV